jgi:hypothetical protein
MNWLNDNSDFVIGIIIGFIFGLGLFSTLQYLSIVGKI